MLESLLQNTTKVYYKMRQVFYCKMQEFHWKMWQLLKKVYFKMIWFSKQRKWSQQQWNLLKNILFPHSAKFLIDKIETTVFAKQGNSFKSVEIQLLYWEKSWILDFGKWFSNSLKVGNDLSNNIQRCDFLIFWKFASDKLKPFRGKTG